MHRAVGGLVTVFLLITFALPAFGQETTIQAELQQLTQRTDEVIVLLRALLQGREAEQGLRRLEVAIAALQLKTGTLANLESRLQQLRAEKAAAEERLVRVRDEELAHIDGMLQSEKIPDDERSQVALYRAQKVAEIERLESKIWSFDQSIIDLENSITRQRRDIDHLAAIVADGLDSL